MANAWFRLYAEFEDDPKVRCLPEQMQIRLVWLFCERCKGVTISERHRTFQWRCSDVELADTKREFMTAGFIDEEWNLLNWDKRQFLSDSSTDRTRRYRERHRTSQERHSDSAQSHGNKNVTAPDTDTDTEANTDKRTTAQSVPPEELAGTLPLVDGSEFPIFKSQVSEWQIAYPGIDVRTQLVQAKVWLQANPKRRKTRKGILRYLNSWLARAQDKPQWTNGANGHAKTSGTGKQAELIAMLHELDEDPAEGAIANGDASRRESFQRAN